MRLWALRWENRKYESFDLIQFVLLNFFLQLIDHEKIGLFIREFFGSHDDGWVVFDKILARLKQKQ